MQRDDTAAIIRRRYGNAVSPESADSITALVARTEAEAASQGLPIINRMPSTFVHSDTDSFAPIPQYRYPEWDTLASHLTFSGITGGVLFILYTTWQLHFPFRDVTRAQGVFAALGTSQNIPLCTEMIRQAPIRCVVLHQNTFFAFRDEIVTRGLTGKVELVIVIRGVNEPPPPEPLQFPGAVTLQEIHAFPGHVVFVQSLPLAGSNDFHAHSMYHLDYNASGTYITGLREDALPAWRYPLPVTCTPVDTIATRPAFTVTPCQTT